MHSMIRIAFLFIGALALCIHGGAYCSRVHARQLPTRLITAADLVYQGRIFLPGTDWSNGSIAFNPARNSVFFVGHDQTQHVAEFSLPALGGTATVLQAFRDPLEGRIGQVNPSDPNGKRVGGLWVDATGQTLVIGAYSSYDGGGTAVASHFVRSSTLAATGTLRGPIRVGTGYAGASSGFFVAVPPEWQASFGTSLLAGSGPQAIVSKWSYGPSIGTVNPADLLSALNPSSALRLLWYDEAHAPAPYCGNAGTQTPPSPLFNGTTVVSGAVIPANTRTLLFAGRQGMGPCEYVPGGGPEAPPYEPHLWAFDLNDILAVKAGTRQPWEARPYATYRLPAVVGDKVTGMATDPATGRIFVSVKFCDGASSCLDVFTIAGTPQGPAPTPPPPAPQPTDVIPPNVTSFTASATMVAPGQPVTFTVTATDNSGVVASVEVFNTTGGGMGSLGGPDTVPPYQATWAGTGPAGTGARTFIARARDAAGNTFDAGPIVVTIGLAAPPPPPPPPPPVPIVSLVTTLPPRDCPFVAAVTGEVKPATLTGLSPGIRFQRSPDGVTWESHGSRDTSGPSYEARATLPNRTWFFRYFWQSSTTDLSPKAMTTKHGCGQ